MPNDSNILTEIELTYLAQEMPAELDDVEPEAMIDIYIPEDSAYPTLRIRQKGQAYEITKKAPINSDDVSIQTEQTIPLNADEFLALSKSSMRTVKKDRYTVQISGIKAEVDVFKENLKGLVLIDFEFENIEAKKQFVAPKCCLVDVTQERFIAGGQLAGKSYVDIVEQLKEFGYEPLAIIEQVR